MALHGSLAGGGPVGAQGQAQRGRVVAHVRGRGRRVRRRVLEVEEREARRHGLHGGGVHQVARGQAALRGLQRGLVPQALVSREAGRGGRRGWRLLEVHGSAGHPLIRGWGQWGLVRGQPGVFHLYEGPLAGGGSLHLVEAGRLELVAAGVTLHKGAEAGKGGGGSGSDFGAAQVHGQLGIVRVHDVWAVLRAIGVGLRCIIRAGRWRAILRLHTGHICKAKGHVNNKARAQALTNFFPRSFPRAQIGTQLPFRHLN